MPRRVTPPPPLGRPGQKGPKRAPTRRRKGARISLTRTQLAGVIGLTAIVALLGAYVLGNRHPHKPAVATVPTQSGPGKTGPRPPGAPPAPPPEQHAEQHAEAPAMPAPAVPPKAEALRTEAPRTEAPKAEPGKGAAWRRNAVPSPQMAAPAPGAAHARIVLVIDDLGVDRPRSTRAVALPGPVTTAWLPYAHDLADQTRAARAAGHELIVHVPMEPVGKADPGPGALTVNLGDEEIQRRLETDLASFDGYVGINNHMGSRFTADEGKLSIVLAELSRRGLMFLDSRTTPDTKGPELAARYHLPLVSRDVFLDDDQSPKAVQAMLAKVEEVARRHGTAVAIGHPHDVTLTALEHWLPTLAAKGFVLVPLTAVIAPPPGGT
ncbi:divergent polysaccharide deacetylase family protein [Nitrospirillum sp. BR 11164]|uniref:divergent polysaccharide deacetylase family protein n=1 Tax=Nitrospirillum sp. BR 11164 TaxID=3104324 RepID=UPI002AFEEFB8|nr:divergent polysaccharide deacetylase family protein [Nitrospirillum sp. BR 11164]MEA1650703.1 divergent polysaccharide deacetylase family protein [Nitrospirillum sp. BR 11164]